MKTPLEQLIDELEDLKNNAPAYLIIAGLYDYFINKAKEYLPEEKQRIVDAYNKGAVNDQKRALQGEQYFKQTYNENKTIN